jgi:hypothetical protein
VSALAAASVAVAMGAAIVTPTLAGASKPAPAAKLQKMSAAELRVVRQFLSHLKIGFRPGMLVRGSVVNGVTQLTSTTLSGYADEGVAEGFTSVSASWVQPTAKCGQTQSLAVFWVGLDGMSTSDPTVEEDGTFIQCPGGNAHPMYFDWWEMYPTNNVELVASVSPGDHIAAKVVFSGGTYTLSVRDATDTAGSFSTSQTCGTTACEDMSAEWIAEDPCCTDTSVYNLANFHSWKATGAYETYSGKHGGISGPPTTDEITLVDTMNLVKAKPGAVNSTNHAFTVTWKKAS